MGAEPQRGNRLLPHTADVIVEAWGPDDLACAEEAAQALIDICVSGKPDPAAESVVSTIDCLPNDLIRTVLEEVVFALDTSELAPVSAHVVRQADSDIALHLGLAPREAVKLAGAAPKAIVMMPSTPVDGAEFVRCRFIVDV